MRVTIDIPDSTRCASLSLVCEEGWKMAMSVRMFGTKDLKDGAVLFVPSSREREAETEDDE